MFCRTGRGYLGVWEGTWAAIVKTGIEGLFCQAAAVGAVSIYATTSSAGPRRLVGTNGPSLPLSSGRNASWRDIQELESHQKVTLKLSLAGRSLQVCEYFQELLRDIVSRLQRAGDLKHHVRLP